MEGSAQQIEQFYETKLFRVLIARNPWVDGHVIIERKSGDPHIYNFSTDDMDEFGYLVKKVSFWVMRLTGAPGFTMLMHDGAPEADPKHPLRIHILPRVPGMDHLLTATAAIQQGSVVLEDGTIHQVVSELQSLMQMPQA